MRRDLADKISWKTRLLRTHSISDELDLFKVLAPKNVITSLFPELLTWKKTRKYLVPNPFPKQVHALNLNPVLAAASTEDEFFWLANTLAAFGSELALFLEHRAKIDRLIHLGDFDQALRSLEMVEEKLGLSFWLIELKIYLIGITQGLDAQKDFTRTIKNNEDIHSIVRIFTHYCSLRSEPRVSWWRYDTYIGDFINEYSKGLGEISGTITSYFSLLLNFFGPSRVTPSGQLLAAFGVFPIVDVYEYFLRIAQVCVSTGDAAKYETVRSAVKLLTSKITDERLNLLSAFIGEHHLSSRTDATQPLREALDAYTEGDYEKCSRICAISLMEHPDVFSFVELHARCSARLSEKKLEFPDNTSLDNLLRELVAILLKTPESEAAYASLRKRVCTLPNLSYSSQLSSFLTREYISDLSGRSKEFCRFGDLNSDYFNPRTALLFPTRDASLHFLQELATLAPSSITVEFFTAICEHRPYLPRNRTQVAHERISLYEARRSQTHGFLKDAADQFTSLLHSSDYLTRQDALLGLNEVASKLGNICECLDLLCGAYIENSFLAPRLPIKEIIDFVETQPKQSSISRSISLPILYAYLSSNIGSVYNPRRDDAYEDFLFAHGAKTPSDLAASASIFPLPSLVHFLRYVCVPDVMDSSVAFRSSEELMRERISICQMLLELDPVHVDQYSDEIKTITQNLVVQRGVREVEQSKIYVEVSGIRRAVEKSLRESFTRYIDLLTTSPEIGVAGEMIVELGKILGPAAEQLHFLIPGNELQSLFREMFTEVRDQFVSSHEFGLDGYLSTGLRHGTLAGQLRAPFEAEHLVTQRDDESKVYRDPVFWLDQYSTKPESLLDSISSSLKSFSAQIDELIDIVRAEWLQIRTEQRKTNGLFDYTVPDVRLATLQAKITSQTSYDAFVDLLFNFLWEITERNLHRIRQRVEDILKPRLMAEVDALEHSLNQYTSTYDISSLTSAITRARTSAQYAADKIASWFSRAKTSDLGPYPLDLPINIAFAVVKNIFPTFEISSDIKTTAGCTLPGKTLTSFANVLFLLLDNVRKHSGIKNQSVRVSVSFMEDSDDLRLEVINDVSELTTSSTVNGNVEQVWDSSLQSFEYVSIEGGSGLHKIKRIFVVELDLLPQMHFAFTADNRFKATISFKAASLLL